MNKPDLSILTEDQRRCLKRDYEKFPLLRGEKIIKEDLEYLYFDVNLSDRELMQVFGKCLNYIQNNRHYYGIYKSKEAVIQKRMQTNIKKYGYSIPLKNAKIQEKSKQTCLERYGVENVMQNEKIKARFRDVSMQRYGTEYPFQNKVVQEHYKETCRKNNGCDWGLESKETRKKIKQTCLEKYGVDNPAKSKEIYDKMRQTCIDRYGVSNFTKSDLYDGTAVTYKAYVTKKERKTINISKAEQDVLIMLQECYSEVINQYRCIEYPFNCDFYIPALSLFIELNFHWTHGKHPFNPLDKKDNFVLEQWINKSINSDFYKSAIEVWTIKDPLKRETAKKNNLNWIEFFNMKQFMEWYILQEPNKSTETYN